jgi:hypothetical protein
VEEPSTASEADSAHPTSDARESIGDRRALKIELSSGWLQQGAFK